MRPNEQEIAWVWKNLELVEHWNERRGGWQQYDRGITPKGTEVECLFDGAEMPEETVWIPGTDDVLAMLEERGHKDIEIYWAWGVRCYVAKLPSGKSRQGKTRLIALMELLKATEKAE